MGVVHLAHHLYADRVMCGHFIGGHVVTTYPDEVTCKKCKETVAYATVLGKED